MCPDAADMADSGTKGSVGVRTWKSSNNRRRILVCFAGISSLTDQVAARLSQDLLLI